MYFSGLAVLGDFEIISIEAVRSHIFGGWELGSTGKTRCEAKRFADQLG
jgi:hypothetical protein